MAWRESIKTLSPEQRPIVGKALNEFRETIVAAIAEKAELLVESREYFGAVD